jgi:hypothetical protein
MGLRLVHMAVAVMAFLAVVSTYGELAAEGNGYVEDFSTSGFCDIAHTTALWDTVGGELRLPPFEPTLAGWYDTADLACGVAISGDYAYVADYGNGLVVVDISDPTTPIFAGSYNTAGWARGVAISGDHAYVADEANGLVVVDISDPSMPTLAGSYNTDGYAIGVAISGDHAYVADDVNGLVVVDISDPTTPTLAGWYNTAGLAYGVAVSGDHAYVADHGNGLVVVDISDPTMPTFAGRYDTAGDAYGIAVSGDHAYVADYDNGLVVVDISDPMMPTLAGSYDTAGDAFGVAISGDHACVADKAYGLVLVDISDPTTPTFAGGYNTDGLAYGIAVSGDHAYVADGANGLVVVDIGYPSAPTLAGSYNTAGSAWGVAISGDHAYVADEDNGLVVVDISDPTTPTFVGSYNTAGSARGVAVSGDHAYVADHGNGLVVVDISDPTTPTLAGWYDTAGSAYGVAISGDYAYVTDEANGLVVVDISDPTTPTLAGWYNTAGSAWGVAVSGDYAYLTDEANGLVVVDISDPTTPTLAGWYDTAGWAYGVAISGDHAYVADWTNGLVVVDISDPTMPALAGSYNTAGYAYGVTVSGDHAYVADGTNGVVVVDISDPTMPALAGSYDTAGGARGVAVSGDHAYVADGSDGLVVLEVYQRVLNLSANAGQSLVINELDEEIYGVRLSTAQTDSIYWYVSADGGSVWDEVVPGDTWHNLTSSGNDLMWRSRHVYTGVGVNPTCTSLEVEWLCGWAVIDSVVDVPGDQGGWARLRFTRSGLDFVGESAYPIARYDVLRRIDDMALVEKVVDEAQPVGGVETSVRAWDAREDVPASIGGSPVLYLDGRYYVEFEESQSGGKPTGTWEVVLGMSAYQEDEYICLVPTVADSSSSMRYSVYCVAAHTTTPSVYYFSPPDSGYSVDNLPPQMPGGLAGQYIGDSDLWLHWNLGFENDLSHWAVYRGTTPDFVADGVSRIGTTTDTSFVDGDYDFGRPYYYKVSAVDVHENESPHALLTPDGVTEVPGTRPTCVNALFQNVPNPFGSGTQIAFSLEKPGRVSLKIYDAKGRLVRELVDEERVPSRYVEVWDGRDNRGRSVASGTYFYRLELPGWSAVRKMTLAK